MNKIFNRLSKYEKLLFLVVTLANLIPVIGHHFFPTLDGPAHLYNANLINHMLFHADFDAFFQFNSELVPNLTGHMLLCFFRWFLPGYLTEKMLLIIYFIGLAYAFRRLVKSINPEYIGLSYLIFPISYNFLLSLGFYNFSLGMIGLLLILSFWIRNKQTIASSPKKILILGIFFILTYFSHILMFSVALLVCGCYLLMSFLKVVFETRKVKTAFIQEGKKGIALLISSLIPIVLMILYFGNRPDTGVAIFLPKEELYKWLNYLNPIICYHEGIESAFTRKIVYILYALIIGGIIVRIRDRFSTAKPDEKKGIFHFNDTWLLITGLMLVLLFIMPDDNGSASIISMRFGLLFFLLLLIWISSLKQAKWFAFICMSLLLALHAKRIRYYHSVMDTYDPIAISCNKASAFIEPNSIVAPMNLTGFWFEAHFSNYLGSDKPMIILDNYEATMNYFPLLWNMPKLPNFQMGGQRVADCPLFPWTPSNVQNGKKEVDYVFALGNWDSTNVDHLKTLELISSNFIQTYKNEHCTLYRRKNLGE